jgi:preprotein translocase subunit YajC
LNIEFLNRWIFLFADAAGNAAGGGAGGGAGGAGAGAGDGSPFGPSFIFMVVLIMIAFYFIMLRPQKNEQKKRLELLNNLKKNDRVVTIGGIYGVVMNVRREADEVVLKIDESSDTKIRVLVSAIARVIVDVPAEDNKGK